MIDFSVLLRSVMVALVIGALVGLMVHYFAANWAKENSLLLAILIGGICGTIYPVLLDAKGRNH